MANIKDDVNNEYIQHIASSKVQDIEINGELKKSFIAYAMAVNVSRAIPDARDGLKPVHRRILYDMNELGLTPDKPHRKCALIVGDVLGKFHPHGDSSVYDALVRLAQDFSIRCPLVDPHGNFGSVDGDSAAAYRYTEARLSKIALEMLRDIDKNTVDMYPNFDNTKDQPVVLPARFPNLLVNGSDGIAVGMATSIPPHNLGEVIDGTIALMRLEQEEEKKGEGEEKLSDLEIIDKIIEYIPAPDFPTGALICGRASIKEAYRTGRGTAVLRARADIEETSDGKTRIVITEIPYQVNKAKLIENIADQVKDKRIDGIADVCEESDRHGMRIVIPLKRDANAQVVLNTLYKQTALQTNVSMIMLALVNGTPRILNLKEILDCYIKHQEDVIVRRTKFDLDKAQERQHILLGLKVAVENIDAIVELIKKSSDKQDAMDKLMKTYDLSEKQANAILEMQLRKLTGLEVNKIMEELAELAELIAKYEKILSSEDEVKEIIIAEMTEIKDRFATPRLSEISHMEGEIDIEDLIEKEDVVISMTHSGYIKRMPVAEYKAQHRGGMGVTAHKAKEEDFIEKIFTCNTHDRIMFFTNFGKVFTLKAYEIPEATRTSRGRAAVNLLQLESEEKVQSFMYAPEDKAGLFLMLATKKGLIKKTPLEEYESIKRNGKIAIKFNEDDELINAVITNGNNECLVAASNGMCIHFHEKDVRPVGRTAMGVKAMNIPDDVDLVALTIVNPGDEIVTVTQTGYGKRSSIADYPIQQRAGKGVKAGVFNDKTGGLASLMVLPEAMDVMMITDGGIIIRVQAEEISKMGRATQGVRIMKLKDDKMKVMSMDLTPHEEEEEVELDENGNPVVAEGTETAAEETAENAEN